MTRPRLRQIPLSGVLPLDGRGALAIFTVSVGQWDDLHEVAYREGCLILELDADERPVAAYLKEGSEFEAAVGVSA